MAAPSTGLRAFVILWCGQFVSLAGSGLSGFALGVYIYQRTGSVTTLGLVFALAYLPLILVSPLTGALVDRWGPWRSMVVSNVGAALVMLTLAVLLVTGVFVTWHIYVIVACISVISALQSPAFEASLPLLVPQRHLGRANGLRMVAMATSQLLAPVAAGFLLLAIGIGGIVLMDCVSYGVALLTLAVIRIPRPAGEPTAARGVASLLSDFGQAWRYVAARPGLVALLVFLGAVNFSAGFIDLLITPLILAFASAGALGTVMSIGGVGMIAASLALSAWGGPRRRINGVLGFSVVTGVATVIGSLRPNIPLIAAGAFLFLGSVAIVVGSNQTIWQSKVEPRLLGRTMAMLNMLTSIPQLVAYALAGLAADHVFQPLVGRDRVGSPAIVTLVGQGPGRGIALLLMVMGVLIVGWAVGGYAYPRLRHLEDELPDMTGPEPSGPAAPAPRPHREPGGNGMTTMEKGPTSPRYDLDYWRQQLGGDLPALDLPRDRPPGPGPAADPAAGPEAHTAPVRLEEGTAQAIARLALAERTTRFVVALAAYQVFLAHLTRQRDIVVGATPLGTGPLAPLRTDLGGMPTFREAVRRVDRTVREAAARFAGPPDRLAEDLCLPRVPGVPPLFQASFRYDRSPAGEDLGAGSAGTDVHAVLREESSGLAGSIECRADVFHQPTAARLADMFAHLSEVLAAAPDTPVFALSPLPSAERERILHGLNRYARPDIGYTMMAQPFEKQVRRTPDAVALVSEAGTLTYAELNTRANQLAWHLRAAGARPGTFVAVSMERSLDLMVALYAVAKSGAAYVPIDPELPDARMAFMLDDSAPVAVLVDDRNRSRVPAGPWLVLAVDEDARQWAGRPAGDLPAEQGNHLIHMLYTSGTTGRPKAVAYPVDGALADIFWLHGRYPYHLGDTAILKTSYGFDVSIWEIFWPLYHGSRVVICPPGAHKDPARLRELVDRYQVTTMFMVPSIMQPFYDHTPPGSCPSLRWVFCGGEPVTSQVRDGFHERFGAALINCYGPTELGCVAETVLPAEPGAPVMVGPPLTHRRVYVLDDNLEPTPIGVAGELFVGGEVGIAQSYHRRSALTAEKFLPDPYGLPGGRMYRTGDMCRFREDGVLEHLGRLGRQAKIRGMRIELAEIEAVFAEHEDVVRCVVTVVPDHGGEIAAFVVPAASRQVAVPALVAHAGRLLPGHMVPPTVTLVDEIPTFVSGKTDFEALLRLDRTAAGGPAPLVAPEGATETVVAAIFAEVLGHSVSVTESFFALGGHSLLLFTVIEMCAARFGVALSARDVLAALSARELATLISGRMQEGGARA